MISYRMCLKLIATTTAKITTKQQRPDCRMARQVQACERKCRCPQRADWSIDVAEAREPPPISKMGRHRAGRDDSLDCTGGLPRLCMASGTRPAKSGPAALIMQEWVLGHRVPRISGSAGLQWTGSPCRKRTTRAAKRPTMSIVPTGQGTPAHRAVPGVRWRFGVPRLAGGHRQRP